MKVKSRKRFFKDLGKIKSVELLDHAEFLYHSAGNFKKAEDIPGFKWMTGYASYGRISIADYRIGVKVESDTLIFICILHRQEVYRQFP